MRALPFLIAAAALSACADGNYQDRLRADGAKDLTAALDGYAATGKTADCLNPRIASGPQIIADTTLLFRETGGRLWRSDVIGTCPSLRPGQTVITEIRTGQLCRNDMFRTIAPGASIPSGYCRYGAFKEYKKAGR